MKKVLDIVLKGEYYDAINRGEKTVEYRVANEYWERRLLIAEPHTHLRIRRGYTQVSKEYAIEKIELETLQHEFFSEDAILVFAIYLAETS